MRTVHSGGASASRTPEATSVFLGIVVLGLLALIALV